MSWPATVIVRTSDSASTVEALLGDLERQTIRPEIVVVDSGSSDRTLELVEGRCDQVLRLPREGYRPGRALNQGAAVAAAPVHFAISSHCRLPRPDWIERSLACYAEPRVAGTNGADRTPDLAPLATTYLQTAEDAEREPFWGYSNHASSWRAEVWRAFPFSEEMPTAEDKEWALRVLRAGWLLAYHPDLLVDQSHRWRSGTATFYRRSRDETAAVGSFVELSPYSVLREWWQPRDPRTSLLRLRLSPRRMAGLAGGWVGHRRGRRAFARHARETG